MSENNLQQLLDSAIKGLQEKKAVDIVSIDLRKIENSICKYFVICNGTSNTHVEGLANSTIDEIFNNCNEKPLYMDGFKNAEWILIDYADIIVHIFQKEKRELYQLETLWMDGIINKIEE